MYFSWWIFEPRSGDSAQSHVIIGIAKSIVTSGYRIEETIVTRSVTPGYAQLKCGDGMKRVLACKLVWLGVALTTACDLEVVEIVT